MLDVERWAELRRERFVGGIGIKELARRYGVDRNTVRRAVRSPEPPRYQRPSVASKLDPFKDEIHRLLKDDPKLSGVRVREEIEPLGFDGGKSIVDDYLREIRPMFVKLRTHQRTVYRPGEVCQWDLWETSEPVPVGHGRLRRAWVVVCCLGYSRAGAGALIFSKEAPDVPGTGKTHISIALGVRACLAGQRVVFRTATEWVALLADAQRQGKLDEELARLERIPVLVCDEVGYIPFDPQAASLMFMLVSRRYERASMIVTSNKPFSAWGEIFGDDMAATAMVDRLIHHAEILSLKGDSYRLNDRDLGPQLGRRTAETA